MKQRLNKDFNYKLKQLFMFTKDMNDKVEYTEILRMVDNMEYTTHTLKYHLKYNYCMSKSISNKNESIYYYTGLKIK